MFDRGFYQAAYRDFENYLDENQAGVWADEAQFYLGRSLQELGSYNEAISEFKRLITNYPTSTLAAPALIRIGECYAEQELYDRAIDTYGRALAVAADPADQVTAYLELGEAQFEAGDPARAIATYEESLRLFPLQQPAGTVNYRLGLLYCLQQNHETAAARFDAARRSPDIDTEAVDRAWGECLLAAGDAAGARAVFDRAARDRPGKRPADVIAVTVSAVAAGDAAGGAGFLQRYLEEPSRPVADAATEGEALYVLALAQMEAGDHDAAGETFARLQQEYPDDERAAAAALWAGRLKLEAGDATAAAPILEEVGRGEGPLAAYGRYWLAWSYFTAGQYDRARAGFEAVAADGEAGDLGPYAKYWAAESLAQAGSGRAAREAFAAFAAEFPEHDLADNALLRKGKLSLAAGMPTTARETFATIGRLYGDRDLADDAAYYYARSLVEEKNEGAAAMAFWNLAAKFPASPYAPRGLFDLAQYQFGRHEFPKATETLAALIAHYPNYAQADDALFLMGECYLNQGLYDKAREKYAQLVEKYPHSERLDEARYETELCNFKQGKYASQIEVAKSYIAMYPQSKLNGELLVLLGDYYYQRRDFDQAGKYLEAVAATAADDETRRQARRKLAAVYLAQGDGPRAIDEYRATAAAAKNDDEAAAALVEIALIYERAGNTEAAIGAYEEILEKHGAAEAAARAQFKIGENLRAVKMYKESNAALGAIEKKWPGSPYGADARLLMGLNYRQLGDAAAAKEHFTAAAASGRREVAVQAYYYLGLCERDLGNAAASRMCFTKVAANYRDFPEWVRKASVELR